MKLKILCRTCLNTPSPDEKTWYCEREVNNDALQEITCPKGHELVVVVQNFKFDVLYELGIEALQSGHYRASATSFATALERCYEFCIIAFLKDKLLSAETRLIIPEGIKAFIKMWKSPLKYSERQLGAFCALHFNRHGKMPEPLEDLPKKKHLELVADPIHFRNRITHEGYLPTREEAVEYGEIIYQYIRYLLGTITDEPAKPMSWITSIVMQIQEAISLEMREQEIEKAKKGKDTRKKRDQLARPSGYHLPTVAAHTFLASNIWLHRLIRMDDGLIHPQSLSDYMADGDRRKASL